MAILFSNNAYGSLSGSISAAATTINLSTGQGARFPSPSGGDYFLATLIGLDSNGNETSWEIVKVTARAGDALTVTRGQESTTAAIWAAGTRLELRVTKGTLDLFTQGVIGTDVQAYDADLAAIAALAGTSGILKKTAANTWSLDTTAYAALASPTFTGTPAAPTAAADTNTTQIATTAYVVGQGYLKSATAASTYLTAANPSYTGTLTGGTGAITIGTTQFVKNSSGQIGIGLTPAASQGVLQVFASGVTGGAPAASGSTDANQIAEIGAGSVQLSFGAYANGDAWIQQRSSSTFATNYAIGLNPNGGRVWVGGGFQETRVAMSANDVNLSAGNWFTKTLTAGSVSLTVSNVPASGTVASFILDLTNGGLATISWFTGIKWAGGSAPTLSSAGRDALGFFSHDGGTTWNGLLLGKDLK